MVKAVIFFIYEKIKSNIIRNFLHSTNCLMHVKLDVNTASVSEALATVKPCLPSYGRYVEGTGSVLQSSTEAEVRHTLTESM